MATSLRDFSDKVHSLVRCVVCYIIPHDLPLNGCGNGHVLCCDCLSKVLSCPICCRRVSKSYQNTVLGQIVEICSHRCTFESFGCSYTTNMANIKTHKATCSFKTIHCPFAPLSSLLFPNRS